MFFAKRNFAVVFFSSVLLLGCADNSLKIIAANDMNNNYPVTLDIVFVYDQQLIKQLESTTSKQWFENKNNYQLNYPTQFDLVSKQIVPLSTIEEIEFPKKHKDALNIILFANYLNDGNHRVNTETLKKVKILLNKKDYKLEKL